MIITYEYFVDDTLIRTGEKEILCDDFISEINRRIKHVPKGMRIIIRFKMCFRATLSCLHIIDIAPPIFPKKPITLNYLKKHIKENEFDGVQELINWKPPSLRRFISRLFGG